MVSTPAGGLFHSMDRISLEVARWRRALRDPRVPRLPLVWRFACAPLAVAAVFLLQQWLNPSPTVAPFVFFSTAVVLVTWLGGLLPGLLSVALSAATANFAFIAPRWQWTTSGPALWATSLFVVSASAVALVCAAFRAALLRAEETAATLRRQAQVLALSDTSRKEAEAAVQRGEALLRAIIDELPSGLSVRDARSGRLILQNPQADRITGGLVESVGDLARYECYHLDGRRYAPEEMPLWRAMQGETIHQEEMDWVRPDGTRATLSIGAAPVRDARGAIVAAVAVMDEITERKRIETALRVSEESFRTLANAIPQLAWMARPDGHIFWYNDRWYQYTGTTPGQMEGWGWQSVHRPQTLPRVLERWKASLADGEPFEMEFPLRGADGHFRRFLTRVQPLKDRDGRVLRWFGTNTDVTDLVEIQRQLRRERDFSSAVVDVAGALVLVLDRDGRITRFNRACEQVSGYAADEVLGRPYDVLMAPEERGAAIEGWRSIRRSGAPSHVQRRWRAKDGSLHLIEWSNTAVTGPDDQVEFIVGTGLDVTERRRAEERIRELNDSLERRNAEVDAERMRWQGVVEGIAEEVWVCDAAGRMSLINLPQGATTMGLEPFEGRTIEQVLENVEVRTPDGSPRPPDEAPLLQALRTGRILRGEEIMRDRRTGRTRHRLFSCAPTRDAAGAITGAVAIVRDVTHQKEAEQALRDSEATLDAFFRASAGILVILDDEFRCLKTDNLSPSYFGLTRETMVGKTFQEIAPEFHERLGPMMREVLESGVPRLNEEVQGWVPSRPGELNVWRASFFPVPLAGGRRGIGVMGLEITDIKRAEVERERLLEELRRADRSKNEFLAVLSHELRNPLAPIRNSLYILDRAAPGSAHGARALEIIDRQVTQLTRLVDDLLDINRISRGKIQLHREPVALDEVVRRVAEDLHGLFEQAGVRLETELAADSIRVDGDRTRLAQIVDNLLQNAAKFTTRNGWARVSLSRENGEAVVLVCDNGTGIEPQLQARLFDSFVQGERTLDRARGGLGLGLALVKGLAELHGGSVSVRSDGVGAGATFTVRLPLARDDQQWIERAAGPRRAGGRRVLLIEDDADTATSLAEALELDGHVVEIATLGAEGLRMARSSVPDVVLCDVGLPDLDGYEVARALRADPRFDTVPLVALSGYVLPEDVERSEQAGFDRHLAKPPKLDELESLLTELPGTRPGAA